VALDLSALALEVVDDRSGQALLALAAAPAGERAQDENECRCAGQRATLQA
jgi:hypothetical protein